MSFQAFLSTLLTRWEESLERALRHKPGEPERNGTARNEFTSTLIVDGRMPPRDFDDGTAGRRLFD